MRKIFLVHSEGGVEGVFTIRKLAEDHAEKLEEKSRVWLNNGNCYDFWVKEEKLVGDKSDRS